MKGKLAPCFLDLVLLFCMCCVLYQVDWPKVHLNISELVATFIK